MNDTVQQALDRIRELEEKLEQELHRRSEELQYSVRRGKVVFERELREKNRAFKVSLAKYIRGARWSVILTAPVTYSLIIPLVLLDIFVSVYQLVCFPVYGIPKVRRGKYLVFDRIKLDYLNGLEKFNCLYCSYGNGVIAYARRVAALTEQYWCPIKHARKVAGTHSRYPLFTDYGDGEQFRNNIQKIKTQFGEQGAGRGE